MLTLYNNNVIPSLKRLKLRKRQRRLKRISYLPPVPLQFFHVIAFQHVFAGVDCDDYDIFAFTLELVEKPLSDKRVHAVVKWFVTDYYVDARQEGVVDVANAVSG